MTESVMRNGRTKISMAGEKAALKKVGYILLSLMLVGSFSLLFSQRVESRTQAAILFDNAAYEEGEKSYKEAVRRVLENHDCYNSGLNLTRMVELSGEREYRMEIHNQKFDMLSGEEMEEIRQEVRSVRITGPGAGTMVVEVVFTGRES